MDKNILEQYIDACELIKETEEDIRKLKRKKAIIQDSVKGSNPEFPYQPQSFHIEGVKDKSNLLMSTDYEEAILEERKANAERLKREVEAWMNTIPMRMQRIIKYNCFDRLSWDETARNIGGNATGESIRKEFMRFMKKN